MVPDKILVVDDEPEAAQLMKMELESEGYLAWTAGTGKEALDAAHQKLPALVLVDIMLPDMTGGEVVKALKADPATSHIPIIFLTALFSKREEKEHRKLVVDNHEYLTLAKPYSPKEFLDQVKRALVRESAGKKH